jgi:NADPH-dependent ferric siderophore reductase
VTSLRVRRQPPAFRTVEVARVEALGPWMTRVTLAGAGLAGFEVDQPAASVRVLLPAGELVIPTWNGNEFLLPGGERPPLRTFTPRRVDPVGLELDIDVVRHDGGVASAWASAARAGDLAAVSGPGRGYVVGAGAPGFLLGGDESAIPAICQLLEAIPPGRPVEVHVEVAHPDARLPLPHHPDAAVTWLDLPPGAAPGDAHVAAVCGATPAPATRVWVAGEAAAVWVAGEAAAVWVAGEAAAVQRIRTHLFGTAGLSRAQATVRGYWKHGRNGDDDANG